jgi:hypothetical protein
MYIYIYYIYIYIHTHYVVSTYVIYELEFMVMK